MQQDVGVAVALQVGGVRDVDAAQSQRSARNQSMGVVADANPVGTSSSLPSTCESSASCQRRPRTGPRVARPRSLDNVPAARGDYSEMPPSDNALLHTLLVTRLDARGPVGRPTCVATRALPQAAVMMAVGTAGCNRFAGSSCGAEPVRHVRACPLGRPSIILPSWRRLKSSSCRSRITVYQKQEGLRASVRGLFRREYRQVQAVRAIDLTVEQGEFVAFLGPNGAGKTTTLKLLSGVISPTSGQARVMGHVPWRRENAYRRRFALVMGQKNQLWWDLPAQESFRLHQQIYRIDRADFQRTLDELTSLLNVRKLLQQPVRELSLGERMKMELIAALLHSPEVLFLDEPTIGLDVVAQHNIQQFLKFYQQKRQITILLTSHYMKDVAALCRRVVIIADGQHPVRRLVERHRGPVQRAQDRDAAVGGRAGVRRSGAVRRGAGDRAAQGQAARRTAAGAGGDGRDPRRLRGRRRGGGRSAAGGSDCRGVFPSVTR